MQASQKEFSVPCTLQFLQCNRVEPNYALKLTTCYVKCGINAIVVDILLNIMGQFLSTVQKYNRQKISIWHMTMAYLILYSQNYSQNYIGFFFIFVQFSFCCIFVQFLFKLLSYNVILTIYGLSYILLIKIYYGIVTYRPFAS